MYLGTSLRLRKKYFLIDNKNSIYNIDLNDSFLSDAINTHNKHRADHKCPPLQHADDLSELAHKIAYYISTRNKNLKNRQIYVNMGT